MSMSKQVTKWVPTAGPGMVVDVFNLVIESATEWVTVVQQERTKRQEIAAWEQQQVKLIEAQKEFLLKALDLTFDERRENFRRLFDDLDTALVSDADDAAARVAEVLGAITELANTSPFKDLKSPEIVVQEYLQSGRTIEI